MFSWHYLWSVAYYEAKTLLRSWFFRIFASFALAILLFMDLGLFTGMSDAPRIFHGLPASIPYTNIILLNVAQAIIAVFLASEFLKRDQKHDTTQVVYTRSMTHAEYVLGKTLGILLVFFILNLIILILAAIINSVAPETSISWPAYFYYPILVSLPTLVFILGLAFIAMILIRNQAVTFILLLGYIVGTLFFLGNRWHHIFDYMAFYFPLLYSDFVGFANWDHILLQRGLYLFLGLGFILLTIVRLRRLPQSRLSIRLPLILAIGFILTGLWMGKKYYDYFSTGERLRQEMTVANAEIVRQPRVAITDCHLQVNHSGRQIAVNARLRLLNRDTVAIPAWHFSLNPGLEVDSVIWRGQKLNFRRRLHVVTVLPGQPLAPGGEDSLAIAYHGQVEDRACYTDIDEKDHNRGFYFWLYRIHKKFSFITPEFVLLTPENLWYPVAGVPFGTTFPKLPARDFIRFQVSVRTRADLQVITPGRQKTSTDGWVHYQSELPLPALTLVIGSYDQRTITVDSIQYCLNLKNQHNYFSGYVNEIGDTLAPLIRELKNNYESKLGLEYPFRQLYLTEVPIQFTCYQRIWTNSPETVQPGLLLISENGTLMPGADFRRMARRLKRRSERSNQTSTPREDQSQMFSQFVRTTVLEEQSERQDYEGIASYLPQLDILPNYFSLVQHFSSEEWPIFNAALELYLAKTLSRATGPRFRFAQGLSEDEKACLALNGTSLAEIFAQKDHQELLPAILNLKSNQIFKLLQNELGSETFRNYFFIFLAQRRFRDVPITELLNSMRQQFDLDLTGLLHSWYQEQHIPGFLIDAVRNYRVMDNERTRFQIHFKITNPEPVAGLISAVFRAERQQRRFSDPGSEDDFDEFFYRIQAHESKEVGIVLTEQPRTMEINTQLSQNIPIRKVIVFENWELQEKALPFEGEQTLPATEPTAAGEEWIVDNESPEFTVLYQPKQSVLKRLLPGWQQKQDRYANMRLWRPPGQWRLTTHGDFYGKFIHSAYYIKSGAGSKRVSWSQKLPESGQYDIYAFAVKITNPWRRGERRRDQVLAQQHFLIHHDDGVEDAILDFPNAEAGWNYLGTYYFSQGTARIELTDQSKGQIVIADAVKWVKR